jgi:hypothetical protein
MVGTSMPLSVDETSRMALGSGVAVPMPTLFWVNPIAGALINAMVRSFFIIDLFVHYFLDCLPV